MYWIALSPSHEDERTAWGWRALQFTPRVAPVLGAMFELVVPLAITVLVVQNG